MSVEVYEIISKVGFISAGIMLVLSVFLFIKFKIPKVYADLSGVAAKREIQGINEKNAQERGKSRKLNPTQYQKGKTSEMVAVTGKVNRYQEPVNQPIVNETEVLDARNYPQTSSEQPEYLGGDDFIVEDDIVFIHTDEIIL